MDERSGASPEEEQVIAEFERRLDDVPVEKAEKLLNEEEQLLEKFRGGSKLQKEFTKVKVLFAMLRDYIKGDYNQVSAKAVAAIVAGLSYLVWPTDLIPDFIPVLGQLDDLAVIFVVWIIVRHEIRPYVEWRAKTDLDYQIIHEELYGAIKA